MKRIKNRRAYHDFSILERVESGVALTGGEIKSIRAGRSSLEGAAVRIKGGNVYLVNAFVNPWTGQQTDSRRDRQLLLHASQIQSLIGRTSTKSVQLVPLSLYQKGNLVKLELGVGRPKRLFEKRQAIKKRIIDREVEREIRGKQ